MLQLFSRISNVKIKAILSQGTFSTTKVLIILNLPELRTLLDAKLLSDTSSCHSANKRTIFMRCTFYVLKVVPFKKKNNKIYFSTFIFNNKEMKNIFVLKICINNIINHILDHKITNSTQTLGA